ncbi:MAG: response regulator [Candidatus Margulisiibacteriota bacterium]
MAKKILIVDDEPTIIDVVSTRLGTAGYDLIFAADGLEGLENAKKELPDLIVLDVMMPGMDGYQVCEKLRQIPETKNIPVIFLTVLTKEEERKRGIEVGGQAFLSKPFEPQQFLDEVKRQLGDV